MNFKFELGFAREDGDGFDVVRVRELIKKRQRTHFVSGRKRGEIARESFLRARDIDDIFVVSYEI